MTAVVFATAAGRLFSKTYFLSFGPPENTSPPQYVTASPAKTICDKELQPAKQRPPRELTPSGISTLFSDWQPVKQLEGSEVMLSGMPTLVRDVQSKKQELSSEVTS